MAKVTSNIAQQTNGMSQNWRDWPIPMYSSAQTVENLAEHFEYFDDDVLINTYAKSGTTLTQEIVYCLLHGIEAAKQSNLWNRSPFLDWGRPDLESGRIPLDTAASLPRPRVLKTHLPAVFHLRHLNQGGKSVTGEPRVIVVMRNLKDTMVSAFHHLTSSKIHAGEHNEDFAKFWKQLAMGGTSMDSKHFNYFDFTLSWWSMRAHPRVRVYFFEDLVTKKAEVVRSIADFLGVQITDAQIQAIVEHTSIDAMRNNANVNPSLREEFKAMMVKKDFNFIRKGQVGDWKNHFTVADSELMDQLIAERLDPHGLKFAYE